MLLSPFAQGRDDAAQRTALLGDDVLLISAAVGGGLEFEDAVVHQLAQPRSEDVLCHSEALLEFAESFQPAKRVSQDKKSPPLADEIERPRYGTIRCFHAFVPHQGPLAPIRQSSCIIILDMRW